MKKLLTVFLLIVMAGIWVVPVEAQYRGRYARSVWADDIKYKNAMVAQPGDNLSLIYNRLKSANLNGRMGSLAEDNRRLLLLSPGTYSLTTKLTLDTNYVDVASMSPASPDNFIITNDDSDDVIEQTCTDVRLSGFTIKAPASNRGLVINLADSGTGVALTHLGSFAHSLEKTGIGVGRAEGDLIYISGGTGSAVPQLAVLDVESLPWTDDKVVAYLNKDDASINGTNATYQFLPQNSRYDNLKFIEGGAKDGTTSGVYGETAIGGVWNNCWDSGIGYCWTVPEDGAIWVECYDCGSLKAGANLTRGGFLWGTSSTAVMAGEIKGIFHRCFGASNCINAVLVGDTENDQGFTCDIRDSIFGNNSIAGATVSGAIVSTFNAQVYRTTAGSESFGGTHHSGGTFGPSAYAEDCKVSSLGKSFGLKNFAANAASVCSGTLIRCFSSASAAPVDWVNGDTTFSATVQGCHPVNPSAITSNHTVAPFESGHTYTNEGASGAIIFTLPPALSGMRYKICRVDFAAGEDVDVDPDGSEHIYLEDGTDVGAGDKRGSDPNVDAYWEITLDCFKDGEWRAVNEKGTGASES